MIVLDTSVLFGFEVESDNKHGDAVRIISDAVNGVYGTAVITDYIFDETVTLTLARTKDMIKAIAVGEHLNNLEILKINQTIFDSAWNIFKAQKAKKRLSFTDCTTIAAMKLNGIDKIATFDSGFGQAKGIKIVD
ncbi:PilT protein domain protein [mine drainage metagenome]|uniref:PilT protein domain protein n=1 Tax=mine drainage metagenome TaxID=410659 RepID=T1ASI2_9ZZZZ